MGVTTPTAPPATGPVTTPVAVPLHLRWSSIGLVFVGGTLGTFARFGLSALLPGWHGIPLQIFIINVLGALVLGWLTEHLARSGPDRGVRRMLRLGAGTGILGGFTTYSTFAVGADGLFAGGALWPGAGYAVATVVVGAAASVAGVALGTLTARPVREPEERA